MSQLFFKVKLLGKILQVYNSLLQPYFYSIKSIYFLHVTVLCNCISKVIKFKLCVHQTYFSGLILKYASYSLQSDFVFYAFC